MTKNVSASVHARLLNRAREKGLLFNELLQHFALERWLYRLSRSNFSNRLILKGGLLLVARDFPISRSTRDVDLLADLSNDLEAVRETIAEICGADVEEDGLSFPPGTVKTQRIAKDAMYEGVRATFHGALGTAKISMQIDLGFSDVVTPPPEELVYPTLLDSPPAVLRVYPMETVLAEKFQSMTKLGGLNSRMKDYFDVWILASTTDFDAARLTAAIHGTFERRETPLAEAVAHLDMAARGELQLQSQWDRFLKGGSLTGSAPKDFSKICEGIDAFLGALIRQKLSNHKWSASEGWN